MSTQAPVVLTIPQNGTNQAKKDRISKLFPKRTILILSITQLICAVLSAILQIILISSPKYYHRDIGSIGTGIWAGVFFGISGGIGFIVSHRSSHCNIIAFMVLCIISSIFTLPLIVISGIGFGTSVDRSYQGYAVCFALQMLIGLLQAVVAIVASGFSCRVVCSGKSQNPGRVIYSGQRFQPQGMYNTQAPQPQMIVVPTGYSGQIPGYPGQTTGYSGQTAGFSGQTTTGHSGLTVQSQTQSDPEYQPQMFKNPGLINVPLNQGPNEELSFPSAEENPEKPPLYDDLPVSANTQLNQPQMVTDPSSENASLNRASNLMDFNATVQNPGEFPPSYDNLSSDPKKWVGFEE